MDSHLFVGPKVIQGRFPGGRPTVVQPKPATAQRQVAAHVQAAIHQGAPAFYRHVAQRKAVQEARRQASTAQRCQSGNATPLPATFHFAPSIGQPLPPVVQRKMEAFFGADFSAVRVHVGPQAQQIGAQAFTLGRDIYFAPGHYMPHHSVGQRLLGHELAHVVQQRAGRVRNPFGGGVAVVQEPELEAEADRKGIQAAGHQVLGQPTLPSAKRQRRTARLRVADQGETNVHPLAAQAWEATGGDPVSPGRSAVVQRMDVLRFSDGELSKQVVSFMMAKGSLGAISDKLKDLTPGDTLFVMGHDNEFGDGNWLIEEVKTQIGQMPAGCTVRLIVCSAAKLGQGSLTSPAQNIANGLGVKVLAATGLVVPKVGAAGQGTVDIVGDYVEVLPRSDITSMFGGLKL